MNETTKITESVRKKVLEIMDLAMLINDSPTEQKLTGNKPTVFVSYSGHIARLSVMIVPQGWCDEITNDDVTFHDFDLPEIKDAEAELDSFIEKLRVILADDTTYSIQQKEKEGNDNEQ